LGGAVLSNNVRRFRETLMMTKAEFARKAGLSKLTIDRVEAGRPCRLGTKRRILQALQLRIDDQGQVFRDSWEVTSEVPAAKSNSSQELQ